MHAVISKCGAFHCRFLTNFRAILRRVIQQKLVKMRASHLIGVVAFRAISILKIEFYSSLTVGTGHLTAEFFDKTGAQEFFMHAEPGKDFHARGQERFTDMKARKFFPLAHDHAPAGPRQQRCRRAARGAAADDRHVVDSVRHPGIKLPNSRRKQTPQGRLLGRPPRLHLTDWR